MTKYWAVGASWSGKDDVTPEFLEKGIWFDGYADNGDDRNKDLLEQVNIGDILLMKSSATKGSNHDITFTRLKGIGKIAGKEDYYSFKVKWHDVKDLPKDFDHISYRKTIEPMRDDIMLEFVKQNINKINEMENIIHLLEYKRQIILQGPPGTGKTRLAKLIAEELTKNGGYYKLIQFHPAYSYDDFVRGIIAKTNGGQIEYVTENKILVNIAEDARKNWDDSKKQPDVLSKEKWVEEKLKEFKEELQECLNKDGFIVLKKDRKPKIMEIEENAFRCNRYDNPNDSVRIIDKDIIHGYIGLYLNTPIIKIKDNQNLSKSARSGMYYLYQNLIAKFKDFLDKKKLYVDSETSQQLVDKNNYILIIDEINRANLPAVLGELIYALEYRNESVDSMYEIEGEREIVLPENLFIIGTMNIADRSVGHIDYAIRRRFAFVDVVPDENAITNETAKKLFLQVKELFSETYISPDFKVNDVMVGHSYFLVKDEEELKAKLEFEIKPILREYLKDGILLETVTEKIKELNV
jgi:MoxR-like ATPase